MAIYLKTALEQVLSTLSPKVEAMKQINVIGVEQQYKIMMMRIKTMRKY